jgi:hypothetical protein
MRAYFGRRRVHRGRGVGGARPPPDGPRSRSEALDAGGAAFARATAASQGGRRATATGALVLTTLGPVRRREEAHQDAEEHRSRRRPVVRARDGRDPVADHCTRVVVDPDRRLEREHGVQAGGRSLDREEGVDAVEGLVEVVVAGQYGGKVVVPAGDLTRQAERTADDSPGVPFSDAPTCRATIRDGRVTLNRWRPGLAGAGPEPAALRTVTAALADLRMSPDRELIVTPVARAPWTEAAEDAILRWAPTAGHRRVWLPNRVVDLDEALAAIGTAAVDCPTCSAHWEDGAVAFWGRVREDGWFPGTCLACGGSLPEWAVVPDDPAQGRATGMERHA